METLQGRGVAGPPLFPDKERDLHSSWVRESRQFKKRQPAQRASGVGCFFVLEWRGRPGSWLLAPGRWDDTTEVSEI
jgi:hypothetical protein